MNSLEWLLAIAGLGLTVTLVVTMILMTRRGAVQAPDGHANPDDGDGARGLSRPGAEPSGVDRRR